jgi:hypothetical protein
VQKRLIQGRTRHSRLDGLVAYLLAAFSRLEVDRDSRKAIVSMKHEVIYRNRS